MNNRAVTRTQERVLALASSQDTLTVRQEMLNILHRAVPFDSGCWSYADPDSRLATEGIGFTPLSHDMSRFLALEYGSNDTGRCLTLTERQASPLYVLSHSTTTDLHRNARGRELYQPHGIGDELRLALRANGSCWGYLLLLRERASRRFTAEEAEFLSRLSTPMAHALRTTLTRVTTPTTTLDYGPGTVILDAHDTIQATTPEGTHWLNLLWAYTPPEKKALFPAPFAVLSVAARLRSLSTRSHLPETGTARIRTRTPHGHWLSIHASPLTGLTTPPATVAVTIQRCPPADAAVLVFHAHGLTPRQTQLAHLLLDGLPNSEIARQLHISTHTVGDHTKAVLNKLRVHSKRELIANILSQRL